MSPLIQQARNKPEEAEEEKSTTNTKKRPTKR